VVQLQVQSSTEQVVVRVEEGYNKVEHLLASNATMQDALVTLEVSSGRLGNVVSQLVNLASQVDGEAQEIKELTYHQQLANNQMLTATQEVENVARQSVATMEQLADSNLTLVELSRQLNNALAQIKLASPAPVLIKKQVQVTKSD
jgi:methyl-accepting chemotaxis protein